MTDRVLHEGGPSSVIVQGMRTIRSSACTKLGQVKAMGSGREIVYAKLSTAAGSAALSVGMLLFSPVPVGNHQRLAVAVTASVGAQTIILALGATSAEKDQYRDGLLIVECGTGSGYSYVIDGHGAWAASLSAAKVQLRDGIEIALTTASLCSLYLNQYRNVATKPDCAAATSRPAGVTLVSAALTNGGFVWLAKRGMWPARVDATAASAGNGLCIGSAAGCLGIRGTPTDTNANDSPFIAMLVSTASVAGAFSLVDLKL